MANISAYPLDPLRARGPRREGIAEVLGLTGNLAVSELHNTHRIRWQALVCKIEFSDPKVGSTEYAPHLKALLVRLRTTRCLNIAPSADPLPGLRVLEHCIIVVNLVLCLEIIRVRGGPVAIQSRPNVPLFVHCLLSHRSAGRRAGDRFRSSSAGTNRISGCFVAQMIAQQYTKPAQRPHAHHLEGMP